MQSVNYFVRDELGLSDEDLMENLVPVGGDLVLDERLRQIQELRDGDVPSEDFTWAVPLLGQFHCLMSVVSERELNCINGIEIEVERLWIGSCGYETTLGSRRWE